VKVFGSNSYASSEPEDELSDNSRDVDIVGRSRPGDRKTAAQVSEFQVVQSLQRIKHKRISPSHIKLSDSNVGLPKINAHLSLAALLLLYSIFFLAIQAEV
jgi:hypothetical protein